jgi:hypothetical protein
MSGSPFRYSVGDIAVCLDRLREADQLLYSAPRTAARERLDAATNRHVGGGAIGGVLANITAAVESRGLEGVDPTPAGASEYANALRCLREAAAELREHPAAAQIRESVARFEGASTQPGRRRW